MLNIKPITNSDCEVIIHCYKAFGIEYTLTLNEALRMGGIARQMDISEDDVKNSELSALEIKGEGYPKQIVVKDVKNVKITNDEMVEVVGKNSASN